MARFDPFPGIRYDPERVDLGVVTSPPYDVIDADERAALVARDPHNVITVDLPVAPGEDGTDADYDDAARRFQAWQDEGVLLTDEPSFYVYRMGYTDEMGTARQTSGVIGALELSPPEAGNVLPHEHTTPKAKTDRLRLYRATQANLSAVWGLSPAEGLGALCELPGPPTARWTDDLGVHHRMWRITQPGVVEAISAAVGSAPVVIADGHHRYATALQYQQERQEAEGGRPGPWDLVMALVVELADDQLDVQPIHRIINGIPEGFDLLGRLDAFFEVSEAEAPADDAVARLVDAGALQLLTSDGSWLLRPRPGALEGVRDLDSSRLEAALTGLGLDLEVTYQHGVDNVTALVDKGADAGVLLRPATVGQIIDIAHGGERMPPKTTFFSPKPSTGQVFRSIA
jgi:uncharacterized protein (DUF1015 family)